MRFAFGLGLASIVTGFAGQLLLAWFDSRTDAGFAVAVTVVLFVSPALAIIAGAITMDAVRLRRRPIRWVVAILLLGSYAYAALAYALGWVDIGPGTSPTTWSLLALAIALFPGTFLAAGVALVSLSNLVSWGSMPIMVQGSVIGILTAVVAISLPVSFIVIGPFAAATIPALIMRARATRKTT